MGGYKGGTVSTYMNIEELRAQNKGQEAQTWCPSCKCATFYTNGEIHPTCKKPLINIRDKELFTDYKV